MTRHATAFMQQRQASGLPDAEWYRQFPKERVARQVWFNVLNQHKRTMTEYLLSAVDPHKPLDILDFGCGIGIPAFALAEKGHRVTALDLQGTGTLAFLKWRAAHRGVTLTIHESPGGVPHLGNAQFDVIIAMDCLEHIPEWPAVVRELGAHLKPTGVLFSNNAILDDTCHPEHYTLDNKAFVTTCMEAHLMPFNQITYVKRAPREAQELAHA